VGYIQRVKGPPSSAGPLTQTSRVCLSEAPKSRTEKAGGLPALAIASVPASARSLFSRKTPCFQAQLLRSRRSRGAGRGFGHPWLNPAAGSGESFALLSSDAIVPAHRPVAAQPPPAPRPTGSPTGHPTGHPTSHPAPQESVRGGLPPRPPPTLRAFPCSGLEEMGGAPGLHGGSTASSVPPRLPPSCIAGDSLFLPPFLFLPFYF